MPCLLSTQEILLSTGTFDHQQLAQNMLWPTHEPHKGMAVLHTCAMLAVQSCPALGLRVLCFVLVLSACLKSSLLPPFAVLRRVSISLHVGAPPHPVPSDACYIGREIHTCVSELLS